MSSEQFRSVPVVEESHFFTKPWENKRHTKTMKLRAHSARDHTNYAIQAVSEKANKNKTKEEQQKIVQQIRVTLI